MRFFFVLSWTSSRNNSAFSSCYLGSLWTSKSILAWLFGGESTSMAVPAALATNVNVELSTIFCFICCGGANTPSCRSCDTLLLLTSRLRSLILICLLRFVYCGKCPKIISFAVNCYLRLVASIAFVLKHSCGELRF